MSGNKCDYCGGQGTVVDHGQPQTGWQKSAGTGTLTCPRCYGTGVNGGTSNNTGGGSSHDVGFELGVKLGFSGILVAVALAFVGTIIGYELAKGWGIGAFFGGPIIGFAVGTGVGIAIGKSRIGRYITGFVVGGYALLLIVDGMINPNGISSTPEHDANSKPRASNQSAGQKGAAAYDVDAYKAKIERPGCNICQDAIKDGAKVMPEHIAFFNLPHNEGTDRFYALCSGIADYCSEHSIDW